MKIQFFYYIHKKNSSKHHYFCIYQNKIIKIQLPYVYQKTFVNITVYYIRQKYLLRQKTGFPVKNIFQNNFGKLHLLS